MGLHSARVDAKLMCSRAEGAIITSSESFLYECMGDASIPE